jgi:hypothetical protein
MFHMAQNLWKYVSTAGYSKLYNRNTPQGLAFKGD